MKRTSSKQKEIAQDIFRGLLSQEQICKKHNIDAEHLDELLQKQNFQKRLERLCQNAQMETQLTIARCGPIAAAGLMDLLNSDKPDVARKAALDMIDRCLAQKINEPIQKENDEIADEQLQKTLMKLAGAFIR